MTNYDNKLRDYSFYQDNKEVVLSEVKNNGLNLQYASEVLQNDKEVVMCAIKNNGLALEFASKKLCNDQDFVKQAVKSNCLAIQFASAKLRGDWSMIYDSLNDDESKALKYASKELRNDKQLVLMAVENTSKSGQALQYASLELRNDKEVVMAAVLHSNETLQYASEELRNDREVALAATTKGGIVLKYMSKSLQAEEAIVDLCVSKNGLALEFASKELRNNKAIVLTAVTQNAEAFHFASAQLQKDNDVITATVNRDIYMIEHIPAWNNDYYKMSYLYFKSDDFNINILQYMGADLKNNEAFALVVVAKSGHNIRYFGDEVRANKSIMWIAVNSEPESIQYASKKLQDDTQLATCALEVESLKRDFKEKTTVLAYISERLCDDKTLVGKAINSHIDALQYASDRIKNDVDFIIPLAQRNVNILEYVGNSIKDNTDIMLNLCRIHKVKSSDNISSALQYASDRIRNDKEFINTLIQDGAVAYDTIVLKHAGQDLLNNKEIMKEFIKREANSFRYASETLRNDIDFVHFTIENRHTEPEIKMYEIASLIGKDLKREIDNNDLENYCKSWVLNNKLDNILPNKEVETKTKLKI